MTPRAPASKHTDYDLVIVGGGLAGVSLALSLTEHSLQAAQAARPPLRIALVEAAPFRSGQTPAYDDRAIALSFGSRRIFEGMGLWHGLQQQTTPIAGIHVSEQGRFGFTRLDAAEEKVAALGYVITARQLGAGLMQGLDGLLHDTQQSHLSLLCPARVKQVQLEDGQARVSIEGENGSQTLSSKLIVAADGGQSGIRQQLGIEVQQRDYRQTAIVANVSPAKGHAHIAYERFTPQGPIALLPLGEQDGAPRCALVWTREPDEAERLLALDEESFLRELQACFGQRLGRFSRVGQRHAYPLQLIRAGEQVRPRLALIGNAAHTLHPIAGQGFNLGLRDVATLAQCISDAQKSGQDIGSLQTLQPYARWRARDHRQVIGFTNLLVEGFSNNFAPLALARNLGLLGMDLLPPLKHSLARHAMGMAGKLPRLARGLPL